jgi:hypothetical protein
MVKRAVDLNGLQRVVLDIENDESVAQALTRFLLSDDLYAGVCVTCGMMVMMMEIKIMVPIIIVKSFSSLYY